MNNRQIMNCFSTYFIRKTYYKYDFVEYYNMSPDHFLYPPQRKLVFIQHNSIYQYNMTKLYGYDRMTMA